ncbi:MAG: phospholipase D-like domain-containing protein [Ilumatobacteraceae bacterium]
MADFRVRCNGDDCFLAWTMPKLAGCWGFAIWRERVRPGSPPCVGYLHNFTGFAGDDVPPHSHRPSDEWPFQRYTWTDHDVDEGDELTYAIRPVIKTAAGLQVDMNHELGPLKVTATATAAGGTSAYFNRGILLSQFVSARLPKDWKRKDLAALKDSLEADDSELRGFLAGQLGARLLTLLNEARAAGQHVYAALYELDDQPLIDALLAFGKRAHIVLANGSSKEKGSDGNEEAALQLDGKVDLHRRMLWSEGLGHNKFLVLAKTQAHPSAVWTGSTNWATTGLCTQMNNGILVEDEAVASIYMRQWKLLRDDARVGQQGKPMHFGAALTSSNDVVKAAGPADAFNVWFTRTSGGQEMADITEIINSAREAILFLMFEPGSNGLLQVVQSRLSTASPTYRPGLYVHGVVNTLRSSAQGGGLAVDLVGRGKNSSFDLQVVQPEGVTNLAGWATEVTRKDFLMTQGGAIGYAIIHSKVIVVDPFTKPVVITGSHNFSQSASNKNDENIMIVRGNPQLAERYAVNIMATYQHYRFRKYLLDCKASGRSPWKGLVKGAGWQKKQADHDRELAFWTA